MQAVLGYYDGTTVKALEAVPAKPNQRVIITVLDEFIVPESTGRKSLRGALSRFADPALRAKEKGAWADAAAEKHGAV